MSFKTFKKMLDGKECEFLVRTPSAEDYKEAEKVRIRAFNEYLKDGYPLHEKMLSVMREQGIWSEESEARMKELRSQLANLELKLKQRGFRKGKHGKFEEDTGYGICLKMRKIRGEYFTLISRSSALTSETAEGRAGQVSDNYLIYASLVYKDSKERVFSSFDEFLENARLTESNREKYEIALEANLCLQELTAGFKRDFTNLLPENRWLLNYKFTDDKGRLINEQGKLIDENGRLIDENGRWIDSEGRFVDADQNLIDAEGNYIVEPKPFLDDDGNPIIDEEFKLELEAYKKALNQVKTKE